MPVEYESSMSANGSEPAVGRQIRARRVFLAGDAVHLMIHRRPRHEQRVGDAIDLSWKLAAVRKAGGPTCCRRTRSKRRQVGERNVAASRLSPRSDAGSGARPIGRKSAMTRRKARHPRTWFALRCRAGKGNEMIGAELGLSLRRLPLIVSEPGEGKERDAPAHDFTTYVPTPGRGARLPHAWLPRRHGDAGPHRLWPWLYAAALGYAGANGRIATRICACSAPLQVLDIPEERPRTSTDTIPAAAAPTCTWLARNDAPKEPEKLAALATGH